MKIVPLLLHKAVSRCILKVLGEVDHELLKAALAVLAVVLVLPTAVLLALIAVLRLVAAFVWVVVIVVLAVLRGLLMGLLVGLLVPGNFPIANNERCLDPDWAHKKGGHELTACSHRRTCGSSRASCLASCGASCS